MNNYYPGYFQCALLGDFISFIQNVHGI